MINIGKIIKIYKNEAIVLTSDKSFVKMKCHPAMKVGQDIRIKEYDIISFEHDYPVEEYENTIIEIRAEEILVLTSDKELTAVPRRPGMVVGQKVQMRRVEALDQKVQLMYDETVGQKVQLMSDEAVNQKPQLIRVETFNQKVQMNKSKNVSQKVQLKNNLFKYASVMTSIAAAIVILIMYLPYMTQKGQEPYAYMDVDINPSVQFEVDKNNVVIKVNPMNDDAEKVADLAKLEGVKTETALLKFVEESRKRGFMNEKDSEENVVLVAVSIHQVGDEGKNISEAEKKLVNSIEDTLKVLEDKKIETKVLRVDETERIKAKENNISMGKYRIYEEAKAQGTNITLEELKVKPVHEVIKEVPDLETIEVLDEKQEATEKPYETEGTPVSTVTPGPVPSNEPIEVPTVGPTSTPMVVPANTPVPPNNSALSPRDETNPRWVDDLSNKITYSLEWSRIRNAEFYKDSAFRASKAGSYAQFHFNGTGIIWYGAVGNNQGKADVYIDDVLDATVDCFSEEPLVGNIIIYKRVGLEMGEHTIKIVVKGENSSPSQDTEIIIDALECIHRVRK
ncbi:MAG: anti-sigma factor domain-containing protein [Clostridia bacterium]|nr:anti-sigma factor domain-containing protein [Clostridia bacterium]